MPNALSRPVRPSADLAAIVGAEPLSRTEVVAKLWDYIKSHKLQDPADKRTIVADAALKPIIGERCTMFALNKALSAHLAAA